MKIVYHLSAYVALAILVGCATYMPGRFNHAMETIEYVSDYLYYYLCSKGKIN